MSSDNIVTLPPYTMQPNSVVGMLNESVNINLKLSNVAEMWKQTRGENCRIAILDTGCPRDHYDLNSIAGSLNMVEGEDGYDNNGHGTHVAGVLSASGNNGIGITGIADKASIYPIKVLSDAGRGKSEWVANAIIEATDTLKCHVVSMSLGGGTHQKKDWADIKAAIKYGEKQGVIFVAATGNEGTGMLSQPARYATIAVGSLDEWGTNRAAYSNYGSRNMVMACGTHIRSTWHNPAHSYNVLSGTSMATPIVSGIVGLLISDIIADHKRDTGLDISRTDIYPKVQDRLNKMTFDIGAPGADTHTGIGIFKFQEHEEIVSEVPVVKKTCDCMQLVEQHIASHDESVITAIQNLLTNAGLTPAQKTGGKPCTCQTNPGGQCLC